MENFQPKEIYLNTCELLPCEPLEQALSTLNKLNQSEYLHMHHRMFPAPLMDMAQKLNFKIFVQKISEDEWHIYFCSSLDLDTLNWLKNNLQQSEYKR